MSQRIRLSIVEHLPLLVMLALVMHLVGCGATPIETAYSVRSTFNTGQQDLIAARPVLDDSTFNALAQLKDAALPVLDALDAAAIEAQASNIPIARAFKFNSAIEAARKVIDDFLLRLATAKQSKTKK